MNKGLWGTGLMNFRDLPLLHAPFLAVWPVSLAERLLFCFQLYVVPCTRPPLLSHLFSASPELQALQVSVLMLSSTSTTSLTSSCFLPGIYWSDRMLGCPDREMHQTSIPKVCQWKPMGQIRNNCF